MQTIWFYTYIYAPFRALGRLVALAFTFLLIASVFAPLAGAKERRGEVGFTVRVEAPEGSKDVRLWLPYPVSDDDQVISDVKIGGNFSRSAVYREEASDSFALYAEWTDPAKERFLTLSFNAASRERARKDFPPAETGIPASVKPYLQSTRFIPADGKVRETALRITEGRNNVKDRARSIYDWVVENTFRDPNVQGCGVGDVEATLAKRGGKCADISSVFVALARGAGIPAREVFGLRLGKEREEDITAGHHCWAEFYLPGYGWVPADPADVRKIMLVKGLELKDAGEYSDYYFGAVDENRIVLAKGGRGHYLNPRQNDGPINYFMYPYAEVNGKALEWLAAQKELKYKITFKELNTVKAENSR